MSDIASGRMGELNTLIVTTSPGGVQGMLPVFTTLLLLSVHTLVITKTEKFHYQLYGVGQKILQIKVNTYTDIQARTQGGGGGGVFSSGSFWVRLVRPNPPWKSKPLEPAPSDPTRGGSSNWQHYRVENGLAIV